MSQTTVSNDKDERFLIDFLRLLLADIESGEVDAKVVSIKTRRDVEETFSEKFGCREYEPSKRWELDLSLIMIDRGQDSQNRVDAIE